VASLIDLLEKKIMFLEMDMQKSSLLLAVGLFALVTLYHRGVDATTAAGASNVTSKPRPQDMARISDGFLDYLRRLDAAGLAPEAGCRSVDFWIRSRKTDEPA
jgi:hypothetical protein